MIDPTVRTALNVIDTVATSLIATGDQGAGIVGSRLHGAASQIRRASCDHAEGTSTAVNTRTREFTHECKGCGKRFEASSACEHEQIVTTLESTDGVCAACGEVIPDVTDAPHVVDNSQPPAV